MSPVEQQADAGMSVERVLSFARQVVKERLGATDDPDVMDAATHNLLCHALSLLYFERAPKPATLETFTPFVSTVVSIMSRDFDLFTEITKAITDREAAEEIRKAVDDLLARVMAK